MKSPIWQLSEPLDAIVFDCDGTLSAIEGIDELARYNNVNKHVEALTKLAMEKGAMDEHLYQKRLQLVKPSQAQIEQLTESYIAHAIKNAANVITCLQALGKAVYVISAGLYPAVCGFVKRLGVAEDHIYAVPIVFDEHHQYHDFDHHSVLINNNGKCEIVEQLKQTHPRILLMGDGMNDLATKHLVQRFVAYGGAFERPRFEKTEEFYIKVNDLVALLPLCLTEQEKTKVDMCHPHLCHQAEHYLQTQQIIINVQSTGEER
jgi:phosphoserine phosphatase